VTLLSAHHSTLGPSDIHAEGQHRPVLLESCFFFHNLDSSFEQARDFFVCTQELELRLSSHVDTASGSSKA